MQGLPGPHSRFGQKRLARAERHEPFTPRLPRLMLTRPALSAVVVALTGIAGVWFITRSLANWPRWMLFPSILLSVIALAAMIFGLGVLTVRVLEHAIGKMGVDWDDDPIAALGVPQQLQRKCEQLGFWTATDVTDAVARGIFPWTAFDYDERMQLGRSAERWRLALDAEAAARRRQRRGWRAAHHAPRAARARD